MSSSASNSASSSASSAMSSIGSALSGNSKNIVMFIVIVAAIAGLLYYIIKNDMVPGLNKFFSNAQGTTMAAPDGIGAGGPGDKNAQLFLFKVDWCPHCKKAKPVFDEVEKELNGRKINEYTVSFKTVDCEAEPDMADKFKIEGYPTIKLVKDGQVIEYDAKPEKDKIMEFLETVLSS
jgi:thiol-disulfide isomerase/thioredoxin